MGAVGGGALMKKLLVVGGVLWAAPAAGTAPAAEKLPPQVVAAAAHCALVFPRDEVRQQACTFSRPAVQEYMRAQDSTCERAAQAARAKLPAAPGVSGDLRHGPWAEVSAELHVLHASVLEHVYAGALLTCKAGREKDPGQRSVYTESARAQFHAGAEAARQSQEAAARAQGKLQEERHEPAR